MSFSNKKYIFYVFHNKSYLIKLYFISFLDLAFVVFVTFKKSSALNLEMHLRCAVSQKPSCVSLY